MHHFKKSLLGVLFCGTVSAEIIGIVGGGTDSASGGGNVFLVNQDHSTTQTIVNSLGNPITINTVAINDSALSIIAGHNSQSYAAFVSSATDITPYPSLSNTSFFASGINSQGISAFVGGSGLPALIIGSPNGDAGGPGIFASICGSSGTGTLATVDINNLGWVISGGNSGQNPKEGLIVATLAPGATTPDQVICQFVYPLGGTQIYGVSLNDAGQAIAAGSLFSNRYGSIFNAYDPFPTITEIPFPTGGTIQSASINESGISLAGGQDNNLAAYATLIQPSGLLGAPLTGDPLPSSGIINSVDVNDGFGFGIMGGKDSSGTGAAYAAFVDSKGTVHQIKGLPTGPNATINSVSMNDWGIALVGGTADGTTAYAALVGPFGGVTPLELTGPPVQSVSIRNFLPTPHFSIPSPQLTGNNLIFAKYILKYARKKALYFSPSLFTNTLSEALQSAAPTRNALPIFAADNNLFALNYGLSSHLRHRRQLAHHASMQPSVAFIEDNWDDEDDFLAFDDHLLASADDEFFMEDDENDLFALQTEPSIKTAVEQQAPREENRPYTLWFEGIGAWASQKAQHQTVGFDPSTGGFIIACEKTLHKRYQVGAGFSYLFTHIHEDEDAGSSNLNQENLFVYGSCLFGRWYLDAALWGGLLQTHQERKIHMTGFNFTSTSRPGSWQLDPHMEVGYTYMMKQSPSSAWNFMVDPFAMLDWANTWQESYKERGHGPFNAGQKSHHSSFLRFETGLRFYEGVRFDRWVLGLEQKGSYVYKNPFSVGKVEAFLVGSPGSFTVETLSSTQSLGLLEVGLLFNPIDRAYPYGSIAYQGEFSGPYQSQQFTLELAWDY